MIQISFVYSDTIDLFNNHIKSIIETSNYMKLYLFHNYNASE